MAYILDDIGAAALDAPADAVNAATGTGENLGWFGAIDRGLDPRSPDQWADPSDPAAQGTSGFLEGTFGASSALASRTAEGAADVAGGAAGGLTKGLIDNPILLVVLLLGLLVLGLQFGLMSGVVG